MNYPIRPAGAGRSPIIRPWSYEYLEDADCDLLTQSDDDDGREAELQRMIARRQAMDQKINAALADDFWDDSDDDIDSDEEDDDEFPAPIGARTLCSLAAETALGNLDQEASEEILGKTPASFKSHADRIDFLLAHEFHEQFLDSREEIQSITIVLHQWCALDGFDPERLSRGIHGALKKTILDYIDGGTSDLLATQIAYKAVAAALNVLEKTKNYLPPLLGWEAFIPCVEWIISHGRAKGEALSIPTVGKLLVGEKPPRRVPITYEMMGPGALLQPAETVALRHNACIVVGENPFHTRLLIEKSAPDHGSWHEHAVLHKRKHSSYWVSHGLPGEHPPILDEMYEYLIAKRNRFNEPDKDSYGEARSLFGNSRVVPRTVQHKVLNLNGRDVEFIGIPNGIRLVWIPKDSPGKPVATNHGLALCSSTGVPSSLYSKVLTSPKFWQRFYDWARENEPSWVDDKFVSDHILNTVSGVFGRGGALELQPGYTTNLLAVFVDALADNDPREGVKDILARPLWFNHSEISDLCQPWVGKAERLRSLYLELEPDEDQLLPT